MDETAIEKQITPYVTAAIRHGITGIAGALALHGISLSDSASSELIQLGTALVLWGIGYVWSWLQKHNQAKTVAALKTGVVV